MDCYDDDGRQGLQEDDLLDDTEVDGLIRDTINQTIGESLFDHANIKAWTTEIVDGCLKRLASQRKPFKYVVTCNIAQKVHPLPRPQRASHEQKLCRHQLKYCRRQHIQIKERKKEDACAGWSWYTLCLHSQVE